MIIHLLTLARYHRKVLTSTALNLTTHGSLSPPVDISEDDSKNDDDDDDDTDDDVVTERRPRKAAAPAGPTVNRLSK